MRTLTMDPEALYADEKSRWTGGLTGAQVEYIFASRSKPGLTQRERVRVMVPVLKLTVEEIAGEDVLASDPATLAVDFLQWKLAADPDVTWFEVTDVFSDRRDD